jgi:hypothetical protein
MNLLYLANDTLRLIHWQESIVPLSELPATVVSVPLTVTDVQAYRLADSSWSANLNDPTTVPFSNQAV